MPTHHLTEKERYVICHMHMAGFSQATIGCTLGRHRGTIGRELKRNCSPFGQCYFYDSATRMARERRDRANRRYKLDNTPLGESVRHGLRQHWSPEQIVGRLKRDHARDSRSPGDSAMHTTHETIYRWVYRRSAMGEPMAPTPAPARRGHRKRRRGWARREHRGHLPGRIGIEHRPAPDVSGIDARVSATGRPTPCKAPKAKGLWRPTSNARADTRWCANSMTNELRRSPARPSVRSAQSPPHCARP